MDKVKVKMYVRPSLLSGSVDASGSRGLAANPQAASYLMLAGALAGSPSITLHNMPPEAMTNAQGTIYALRARGVRVDETDESITVWRAKNPSDVTGGKGGAVTPSIEMLGAVTTFAAPIEPTFGRPESVAAATVSALRRGRDTIILDPTSIRDWYPEFFDHMRTLGADVTTMSNVFGNQLQLSVIGESHSRSIGVVMEGVPRGVRISKAFIQAEMEKRRSTTSLSTSRREGDVVEILAGTYKGVTTGEPVRLQIMNGDTNSGAYERNRDRARPGHGDLTARTKYGSVFDYHGGGFLSGRMTACFVAAGAFAKKIIALEGVTVISHTTQVGRVKTGRELSDSEVRRKAFTNPVRCADPEQAERMARAIERAKRRGDSLGGVVECRILGMPIGIGEPLFLSVESVIAQAMFSIPAVKGVEFGSGFAAASMKGSEHNDPMRMRGGEVVTLTNNAGGVLGGISNGMPIVFRVAIKPTSSIAHEQDTVDMNLRSDARIRVIGRHDPCITIRAPPVVEAMAALSIADLMLIARPASQ